MRRTSESTKNIILHGSPEPPVRPVLLRTGRLSLLFCDGELRNVTAGDSEIVRRIYVAVRDKYWNTARPAIADLRVERGRNSFSIHFDCRHKRGSIDFVWHASIDGRENGTVSFSLNGKAQSSFEANRIGFCVLLPLDGYLGNKCVVEMADGTRTPGIFPDHMISPRQPITDLRALFVNRPGGVSAEIRFEGDVYEMEDQRNWTDASFKVYCPPLKDNIPFCVKRGDRFAPQILLRLKSPGLPHPAMARQQKAASTFDGQSFAIPNVGVELGDSRRPLSAREAALVGTCGFSHVRANVRFDNREGMPAIYKAAENAEVIGLPLELALFFRARPPSIARDAKMISEALQEIHCRVDRCLVFNIDEKVTSRKTLSAFRAGASRLFNTTEIVTGTNGYFVEINRSKPALRGAQGVCYSVNPQVHTFDDEAILDNLEGQYHVLRSARARFPGRKLVVTPVSLRPRLNPLAPRKDHGPDPRQKSLLGAVWTLGSIVRSARGGAASVTYFQTSGDCGIMERGGRRVFPMFHVFADMGEFTGGRLRPLAPCGEGIDGCVLEKGGRRCFLIANLTPVSRKAVLRGVPRGLVSRVLDERSFARACRGPLDFRQERGKRVTVRDGILRIVLRPYAIVRLDEVKSSQ